MQILIAILGISLMTLLGIGLYILIDYLKVTEKP